jgi:23S rRNA (cytidine1920-2'-O)/16S rRNA (cytidine1409-2'-O)-methyltransferase
MRLDEVVLSRGLAPTRSAARAMIMAGLVLVEGKVSDKAGTPTDVEAAVSVKERPRFVSRAGEKLDAALDFFGVDVAGVSALDVGASTGGFVDCVLQRGASRVIALDVGRGQLDSRLRSDPRVHVIEGVNARYLEPGSLPWVAGFLTMDVSFISVTKVIPAVVPCLEPDFTGVVLIKPQFEAGPRDVGKGGIVRNPAVHRRVLREVVASLAEVDGVTVAGVCRSAVPGTGGNVEFFLRLTGGGGKGPAPDTLDPAIDAAVDASTRHEGEGQVEA